MIHRRPPEFINDTTGKPESAAAIGRRLANTMNKYGPGTPEGQAAFDELLRVAPLRSPGVSPGVLAWVIALAIIVLTALVVAL